MIIVATIPDDLPVIKSITKKAFSSGSDSSIDEWFSFDEMVKIINQGRGVCLEYVSDNNEVLGIIFAAQESPINGRESEEKWVIYLTAVIPEKSGTGIGTELLKAIETEAKKRGVIKIFVFTNKGDDKVIHFYQKNGYEDAGWIRNYQYGNNNSAVFLLKNL